MKGFSELLCELEDLSINYWGTRGGPTSPTALTECRDELLRRYELAQRARARNLVRAMRNLRTRIWQDEYEWKGYPPVHRRVRLVNWLNATSARIAAKYLDGKS